MYYLFFLTRAINLQELSEFIQWLAINY